jgi:hypothetical protein
MGDGGLLGAIGSFGFALIVLAAMIVPSAV